MRRDDLLEDDEALDRALATLGETRMAKRRRSSLSRAALAAAGIAGLSGGMPAWAIGMLVVGGLSAGAGTTWLAREALEPARVEPAPAGVRPAVHRSSGPEAAADGTGSREDPQAVGTHTLPAAVDDRPVQRTYTPPTAVEVGPVSSRSVPSLPAPHEDQPDPHEVIPAHPPSGERQRKGAARPASGIAERRSNGRVVAEREVTSTRGAARTPEAGTTPPPASPAEQAQAAERDGVVSVAGAPLTGAASRETAATPPPSAVSLPRPLDAHQIDVGAEGVMHYEAAVIPEGGPQLRVTWRHAGSSSHVYAWRAVTVGGGLLQAVDSQRYRWSGGLDLAAGMSVDRPTWRIDLGLSLGARFVPATPQARSPEDLANAGWLFLVSGPRLGVRIGPANRWGLRIQLDLGMTWLNLDSAPEAPARLHPRFGLWTGLELPTR
jgi:hypothetical protein